jgi:hypothetical protein
MGRSPRGAPPGQAGGQAEKRKKQAVVVIHGMGDQRPMDTLRSFVETVWCHNPKIKAAQKEGKNRVWIVPDTILESYEQRRITTGADANGVRTDFYEVYWADIMEGTTLQHLWAWVRGLLFRWPRDVPSDVFSAWLLLWFGAIAAVTLFAWSVSGGLPAAKATAADTQRAAVALAILAALAVLFLLWRAFKKQAGPSGYAIAFLAPTLFAIALYHLGPTAWLGSAHAWAFAASVLIGAVLHSLVVPTFGDVARYVRAAPNTVEKRQTARDRALKLLEALHGKGEYQRIVVVAHSLGSIIAYDVLMLLWAKRGPGRMNPPSPESVEALQAIDRFLGDNFEKAGGLKEFQEAQSRAFKALRNEPNPWLVSDFVTLGSPLTHAEFLIEPNMKEVQAAIADRLLATCPPAADDPSESKKPSVLFQYKRSPTRYAHHAALFSCVQWANVYDPASKIFFGDIISGRLAPFGRGIKECEVTIQRPFLFWRKSRVFVHTHYWDLDATSGASGTSHLECLWSVVARTG